MTSSGRNVSGLRSALPDPDRQAILDRGKKYVTSRTRSKDRPCSDSAISIACCCAHIGPFLFAFSLLMFLLLLQFLARYLPELVGKDLGAGTILELIAYNLAYMVVLAVPMAVLVAALVAYGDMAEFHELTAARAAGIHLLQLMRPTLLAGALLMVLMAVFAAEILPRANARARALWIDIRRTRPAFALRPGTFYTGLEGYSIYVERIENNGRLHGLLIYDYAEGFNRTAVITAREGILQFRAGGRTLRLVLQEGAVDRQIGLPSGTDHRYERMRFQELVLYFDLSEYRLVRSESGPQRGTDRTMTLGELRGRRHPASRDQGRPAAPGAGKPPFPTRQRTARLG